MIKASKWSIGRNTPMKAPLVAFLILCIIFLVWVYQGYISFITQSRTIPRITPKVVAAFEDELSIKFPEGTEFIGTSSNLSLQDSHYYLNVSIPFDAWDSFLRELDGNYKFPSPDPERPLTPGYGHRFEMIDDPDSYIYTSPSNGIQIPAKVDLFRPSWQIGRLYTHNQLFDQFYPAWFWLIVLIAVCAPLCLLIVRLFVKMYPRKQAQLPDEPTIPPLNP